MTERTRTALLVAIAPATLLLGACAAGDAVDDRLARALTGTFTSAGQAADDPENYLEVELRTASIWAGRDDGPWLYVEQAMAARRDRPYRQRVYRIVALGEASVRSDVYTLPGDALRFAGAWGEPEPLAGVTPEDLALREGCSITLEEIEPMEFVGSTSGTGCASALAGADHATSEVRIFPWGLETWDRGFDASGAQVWGAEAGPYRFVRTDDEPGA